MPVAPVRSPRSSPPAMGPAISPVASSWPWRTGASGTSASTRRSNGPATAWSDSLAILPPPRPRRGARGEGDARRRAAGASAHLPAPPGARNRGPGRGPYQLVRRSGTNPYRGRDRGSRDGRGEDPAWPRAMAPAQGRPRPAHARGSGPSGRSAPAPPSRASLPGTGVRARRAGERGRARVRGSARAGARIAGRGPGPVPPAALLGRCRGARRVLESALAHAGHRGERDPYWDYPASNAASADETVLALRREARE